MQKLHKSQKLDLMRNLLYKAMATRPCPELMNHWYAGTLLTPSPSGPSCSVVFLWTATLLTQRLIISKSCLCLLFLPLTPDYSGSLSPTILTIVVFFKQQSFPLYQVYICIPFLEVSATPSGKTVISHRR